LRVNGGGGDVRQAHPQYAYMQLRKYFINGVANLLAIVTNSNCTELMANHKPRMEALYNEMVEVLKHPHAEGFVHMPKNFKKLVFEGLASYGSHYPSSKHDFDNGGMVEVRATACP
jgi:ketopantoate reductase